MEKVGDYQGQAARLTALLTDDVLHRKVAGAARQTALSRFCTDLIIPRYESYYQRVCNGKGT